MNEISKKIFGVSRKVLIDTWWNVNVNYANDTLYTDTVLIDTWWNVNISERAISTA